ncbi:hypothetical protein [Nocardia nepalensis]|uniref:hypothetical protein n=1 Tax=Nocardia nepalensis TaxID=3375448 RepID=UPI003B6846D5
MSEMPPLIIPNQWADNWPKERLFISPVIENYLDLDTKDGLKGIMRMKWQAYGKGATKPPPEVGAVPQVVTPGGAGASKLFDNYLKVRNHLSKTFDDLQKLDVQKNKKVADSDKLREEGQGVQGDVIRDFGDQAGTPPPDDMTEDEHILKYSDELLLKAQKAMNKASEDQQGKGKEIDDLAEQVKTLTAELKKYKDLYEAAKKGNGEQPSPDPSDIDPNRYNNNDPGQNNNYTPPPIDPGDGTGLGNKDNGLGGSDSNSGTSGANDRLQSTLDRLTNAGTGAGSSNTPSVPNVDTGSAGANMGSNLADQMLPLMMSQAMQRNAADEDLNNRREDIDPNRYEQYPGGVMPGVAAQTAAAQPANAAAAAPAAPANTAPPQQASSTQPVGAPARATDADGTVVYTLPDGRTRKVPANVAQGLDAAFDNASGTDAQAAYAKTTSKWADKKDIGARVNPMELKTGDVGIWEGRTALLVVFGPGEGETLEAIVNGALVPVTTETEMSDSAGSFGKFSGFARPKGTEMAESGDKNAAPEIHATDPSATAAAVVAAPA